MKLLLDTNVVSEFRKIVIGQGHPNVTLWAKSLPTLDLFISVITVYEVELGIVQTERRDPRQGRVFRGWLESYMLPAFETRILPLDTLVAKCAARLHVPDPQPLNDSYIAATALVHGMTVATRNIADFAPMGVALLNPWEA